MSDGVKAKRREHVITTHSHWVQSFSNPWECTLGDVAAECTCGWSTSGPVKGGLDIATAHLEDHADD